MVKETIQLYIKELVAKAIAKPESSIDITAGFFDLGMDSKMTMELVTTLEQKVGHELYPTLLFEHQNIEELSDYLFENDAVAFQNGNAVSTTSASVVDPVEKEIVTLQNTEVTKETILEFIKELIAPTLNKSASAIDASAGFFDLGMDSKMTMELVSTLEEKVHHELYPTLLFEYQNIEELSDYLFANDREKFAKKATPISQKTELISEAVTTSSTVAIQEEDSPEFDVWGDTFTIEEEPEIIVKSTKPTQQENEPIAIIGLSGRYPKANTLSEFWENLKNGKDCVTEIPKDRWNADDYFDPEKGKTGKTYSKWGGFIEDADKFDPLFFGMSPIAAENMDPQARIFLEETWKTIEDAGYNPAKLSSSYTVGVYAGVFWTDYQLFRLNENESSPSSFVSTVANMTSFYLGCTGPSIGLDTQCSSSLTAIHLASESLRQGKNDVAIAGGVNLSVHPSKYNWLSNARFLSDKGKCEAFGEGGNGYVPSEGVGVVLLKRLSDAKRDNDQIYAVIKGDAINHGGRSSGLTVPNLNAQAEVIQKAMKNAEVQPEDYGYVEAHGTGTSLGDPIEIAGLNKAFENKSGQYCAIGSVKSNIGHAESAAGIAGFTKVLLQLKHKQIVPSLHSSKLNTKIDFAKTAFIVPQTLQEWTAKPNKKRLAGLSSFGAGGSNAHIILEEYSTPKSTYKTHQPAVIVVSAKNKERLHEQVKNLINYADNHPTENIYNIAYTLQVGRQAMEERIAFLANDVSSLKHKLQDFLQGKNDSMYVGNILEQNKDVFILKGKAGKAYIQTAIQEQEIEALIQLWVKGMEIDWSLLYNSNNIPHKISLPTYPFARERYWVSENLAKTSTAKTSKLHPLVHSNESTFTEQKYTTTFTGDESFLEDHKVENQKILPGVAYLEWAREVGSRSLNQEITQLTHIKWMQPIIVHSNPEKIHISFFEEETGYGFEMYSEATKDKPEVIYCQGSLQTTSLEPIQSVDIKQLQLNLTTHKSGAEVYQIFRQLGIDYGTSFQGIKNLYYNSTASLSELEIVPDADYVLQTTTLDCSLQTILGINLGKNKLSLDLPFSSKKVRMYGNVQDAKWSYVRHSKSYKEGDKVVIYDIDLLSEDGKVLLQFSEVTTLPVQKSASQLVPSNTEFGLQLYTTAWKPKEETELINQDAEHFILIAGGTVDLEEKLKESLEQEVISINESTETDYYLKIQNIVQPLMSVKNKVSVTLVYKTEDAKDFAFVSGLLKTAQLESRNLSTKTLGVEELSINSVDELSEILQTEQFKAGDEVRFTNGVREERCVCSIQKFNGSGASIKDHGVYLITGGCGGLGKIFAHSIAQNSTTKLILTGRSKTSKLSASELEALNASYHSCDVTNKQSIALLIQTILKTHGKLDGIIHSAGVIADSFLLKKTEEEAIKVLQPKINGVKYLDELTQDIPLDFMVFFSSMAAVTGNFGQADYASANTWMDNFAVYRNELQQHEKRNGHTLSINWPLWKDGGMQMDEASEKYVKQKWGMSALPTADGLFAFEELIKNQITQGVVAYGEGKKIHSRLVGEEELPIFKKDIQTKTPVVSNSKTTTTGIESTIEKEVFAAISNILRLDKDRINKQRGFGDYGFDSVMMIDLVQNLNTKFEGLDLAPTALINYATISEFLDFLLEEHKDLFQVTKEEVKEFIAAETVQETKTTERKPLLLSKRHKKRFKTEDTKESNPSQTMAIVAMNGRFSNIKTEEALWQHTTENVQLILDSETGSNKTFAQIDLQSPEENWSVLNLNTSEIQQLSSQEKLIFEVLSNAMKHYNISGKSLASVATGVFIAAGEFAEKEHQTLAYLIPNKVSYHLNLKGPSELVNTYCTSCYVAIHRALQSIASGECEQAIVGGVNLVSQEEMTKALASDFGSLFSKKGATKSFSEQAEGFVRSEGAGVIIIKPLEQAEKDGNTILGLIKGSSVFHGGKGFSLEAPNARGIKKAIETSIQKSKVSVDTIDYIEAHGIANRMADAIELAAIDEVYKKYSKNADKKWHIGTSKPVIGHSELASGMASIIKVLKAFEHKTIPGIAGLGTINSELNPNHSLILTSDSSYWKNGTHPRRAGLNSYAVGGVNAHLILEEYKGNAQEDSPTEEENFSQHIPSEEHQKTASTAQETSTREILESLAFEVFQIAQSDFNENLSPIDYDFDSVQVIAFVNRVNQHFQVSIKLGQILGADDFKSMFDVFEKVINSTTKAEVSQAVLAEPLERIVPLSEGQKGLWFIQKRAPESTVYNIPIVLKITAEISNDILQNAFQQLLQKHAALNVLFEVYEETGETFQILQKNTNHAQPTFRNLTQGETIEEVIATLQNTPFDLSKEVIRLHILTTEQEKYAVFLIHHIAFDGSSLTPFLNDLKHFIKAFQEGRDVSVQTDTTYFDFIQEETEYLNSGKSKEDLAFWKSQFHHSIETLELPYDTILEEDASSFQKEGIISTTIDEAELLALKALAKSLKTNLSVVLLSAFNVLLHKLSSAENITVKMPTLGRNNEKHKECVGYYINRMLLTTQLNDSSISFADIVKQVKNTFLNSIDHVQFPYSKLLASLDAIKGKGEAYFPVSFAYQNIFSDALKNEETSIIQIDQNYQQQLIDTYGLDVIDLKDKLLLQLKYRKDAFKESSVQKHLEYFQRLLQSVLDNSEISLENLDLLSEEDKNTLLKTFNDTHFEYPLEGSGILEQIKQQVAYRPQATAISFGDASISYEELWQRSEQLAKFLQSKQTSKDTFVGIYRERSITTVVSMVGVLLAGAAYVPIDAEYPTDRVAFILEDAVISGNEGKPKLILTQSSLVQPLNQLELSSEISVITIHDTWQENTEIIAAKNSLQSQQGTDHAAYVIYTSGSTGTPKGVVIEHRSFIDLIQYQKAYFEADKTDQFVQFSNFTFDASVEQIFLPLVSGATLNIVTKEQLLHPEKFQSFLLEKHITHLHAVPLFLRELPFIPNTKLKRIISGGDVFDQNVLNNWGGKGIRIIDKYGPTETTVSAVQGDLDFPRKSKHIGKPLGNTQCYILNKHLKVQPIGVAGELYIGGAGLSRGYLNREELTAEKFINNPFGEGKLYKTGDLARWLADGNIDFLGRVDFQVKIRGFRIELGEIETVINSFEGIHNCIVIAKEISETKQLAAYCETEGNSVNSQFVKEYLGKKLPEYMIPKFVIAIEEIPKTSSGKANRKLLQSLPIERSDEEDFVAPKTATEKQLALIWQELLSVEKVGLNDHFFDLGGHSLLVTRLLSKTKQVFGVSPSISEVFAYPTIKTFSKVIDESHQQAFSSIKVVENRTNQPLTSAQKRLWFLAKMGQSEQYHIPHFLRIKGSLNVTLLEQSLNDLLERHEVLRTYFTEDSKGTVVQNSHENKFIQLEHSDVSETEETQKQQAIQEICEDFIQQPFDLSKDLLIRGILIHVASHEFVFGLSIHHIVFDGWSMEILMEELQQVYTGLLEGISVELPANSIHYLDYAAWQQSTSEEALFAEGITYWKTHLTGYQDLQLPTDKLRPKHPTGKGKSIQKHIDENLKKELTQLSQSTGSTLFTSLLSAVYILLNKYSGQEDICIGIPVANREHPEVDRLIGLFVNTIVSRVQLESSDTLEGISQKVQTALIKGQEHQSVPFDKVVEMLHPSRETGITPIFQVMVNYLRMSEQISLGNAIATIEEFQYNKVKFDLSIDFVEISDTELIVSLRYNQELFLAETAARFLDSLVFILESLSTHRKSLLQEYSFISETDQQRLVKEFNNTSFSYPAKNNSIQSLFASQVKKRPHAIALKSGQEELSYQEVDKQSELLASYLQANGVTPDTLVGIFMDRSVTTVVAMLAVLKSGGAYVPLDPDYPEHRINFILEDSIIHGNGQGKPQLVITHNSLEERFHSLEKSEDIELISINQNWFEKQHSMQPSPLKEVHSASNLAYVIFTSGSTGNPKGVLIEHRSFIDLIHYQKDYFEVTENDQFLQFSNFSFDASVEQIFLPIVSGATLHILPKSDLLDADSFKTILLEQRITHLHAVPSFLQEIPFIPNTRLRRIISGGDVFNYRVLDRWGHTGIRIIDKYGPTESTVSAIQRDLKLPLTEKHIGRPLGNTTCYVVDAHGNLQPIGVPGELYIGGNGLARGYLNRPELTAEKFIDNPFGEGKVYKTGDWVRWTPHGNIDFLGRIDHQVKIRGFRIELGEIENTINQFETLQNAVVIAKEHLGSKQLVAYCLPKLNASLDLQKLRDFLAEKLPEYMVPKFLLEIDAIPLTPNRKVDRKFLQAKPLEISGEETFVEPNSQTEKELAAIWKEVLQVEKIGLLDHFFDLGGHSLLMGKLMARINEKFQIRLSISQLFDHPRLDQLARAIDQSQKKQTSALSRVENREQQPLSFAQQSLWILSELGQGDRYHIPKILRIEGELDIPVLKKSLNDLLRRHEALRTQFRVDASGNPYQFIEENVNFTLDVEACNHTSDSKEKEIKKLFKAFVNQPFNLQKDLLIRGLLIKLAEKEYLFGLCIHHIVFDGWSSGIFMKELAAIYEAHLNTKPVHLPELPIQYLDYSAWQQEASQKESFAESLTYWKKHLQDYQDLDLSTDFPRPKISSRNGKRITKTFSKKAHRKLVQYCKESKATFFAGLLSSVYILLNKYTGQDDICIGIPVANREHKELEGLVGFFVNTIVSRIQFTKEDTLQSIVQKVQKELMIGQEHQQVPFQKVVETVQPNRDFNHSPIFQVMVNYLKLEESFSLQNTTVKLEESAYRRIKFDLNIDFIDTENSGLFIAFTYNSDLYTEATAERLLESLNFILKTLPEVPNKSLHSYSILNPKEKLQLLTEFNNTSFSYPNIRSLFAPLEMHAKTHPDWIAVQFEEEKVSYAELHKRSQQLALFLQQQGVTTHTLVGIYMNKSIEAIVSMLGILMSGGAYVPIDPEYPESRVRYILEDAIICGNQNNQANIVLVQSDLEHQLRDQISAKEIQVIALQSEWLSNQEILNTKGTLIKPDVYDQLAYVIYTSGSTGKPKGVLIEHRNVINLIAYQSQYFKITPKEQILLFSSFSFDASVEQMYLSLFNAATLHIVSKSDLFNTQKLQQILIEREITHLHAVPSFVREIPFTEHSKLKRIISGGDVFDPKISETWGNQGIHIINEYGPTETTVTSIQTALQETIKEEHIGKPLGNTQCYIVDENNSIQPIGVFGELWIGGHGVARGYLNREELTQERFISNPFGEGTIYKTGDIARWLPNGNIAFLGRIDHQVKIRGFRIELGEIESCLDKHPNIKRSVVIAKKDAIRESLVAFCVLENNAQSDAKEVKEYLQQQLPEYMVPSFVIFLEAIPLTANGKEDKKKLMSYEIEVNDAQEYTAPSTPSEKVLAQLWEETLNIKKIGIHDNFFDLGGHSLLIIQLNQKIRQTIGNCTIELIDFINNPTLYQQALLIEKTQKKFNHLITFSPSESQELDTFIIPGMPGLAEGYYELAAAFASNKGSVYGIQMKGIANHEKPSESIEEMAMHNIQVLKQTDAKNIRLIGHSYGGTVIVEMLKQLSEEDIQVKDVIFLDCHAPKKGLKITQIYQGLMACLKGLSGIELTDMQLLDFAKRVAKKPKERRKECVYNFIHSHQGTIDKNLYSRLYDIYLNAMTATYTSKEILDVDITLVIAKASKRRVDTQLGWTKYFKSIETISTQENHFDLVKKPHIPSWKYKLEKIELS